MMKRYIFALALCIAIALGAVVGARGADVRILTNMRPDHAAELERFLNDRLGESSVVVERRAINAGTAEELLTASYDLVFSTDVTMERFAKQGALLPLDSYLSREPYEAGVVADLIGRMPIGGRMYDLPVYLQPTVVVYDKEAFRRMGVRIPVGTWTRDNFIETAALLTVLGDQGDAIAFWGAISATGGIAAMWPLILHQTGYDGISTDDTVLRETLGVWSRLALNDSLYDNKSVPGQGYSQHFARGQAAMSFMSFNVALDVATRVPSELRREIDWGITPIPGIEGRPLYTPLSSSFTAFGRVAVRG